MKGKAKKECEWKKSRVYESGLVSVLTIHASRDVSYTVSSLSFNFCELCWKSRKERKFLIKKWKNNCEKLENQWKLESFDVNLVKKFVKKLEKWKTKRKILKKREKHFFYIKKVRKNFYSFSWFFFFAHKRITILRIKD